MDIIGESPFSFVIRFCLRLRLFYCEKNINRRNLAHQLNQNIQRLLQKKNFRFVHIKKIIHSHRFNNSKIMFLDQQMSENSSDYSGDSNSSYAESSDSGRQYECKYCSNWMPWASLEGHYERKHSCSNCNNRMSDEAMSKHFPNCIKCPICSKPMLKSTLEHHYKSCKVKCSVCQNIMTNASFDRHFATKHHKVAEVTDRNINDTEFNRLLAGCRLIALNGKIYTK